jgi:hypothetical protein
VTGDQVVAGQLASNGGNKNILKGYSYFIHINCSGMCATHFGTQGLPKCGQGLFRGKIVGTAGENKNVVADHRSHVTGRMANFSVPYCPMKKRFLK